MSSRKRNRTATKETDRVAIDVGGTIFQTFKFTLGSCDFFNQMFSVEWQEAEKKQNIHRPEPRTVQAHFKLPAHAKYCASPNVSI